MNLISTLVFQFGTVAPPSAIGNFRPVESGGLGQLLNLVLNVMVVAGGIYALFNFILAGYMFFSAADDPKKAEAAWGKFGKLLLDYSSSLELCCLEQYSAI